MPSSELLARTMNETKRSCVAISSHVQQIAIRRPDDWHTGSNQCGRSACPVVGATTTLISIASSVPEMARGLMNVSSGYLHERWLGSAFGQTGHRERRSNGELNPLKVRPGAKYDWNLGQKGRKDCGGGALGDGCIDPTSRSSGPPCLIVRLRVNPCSLIDVWERCFSGRNVGTVSLA